MSVVHFETGDGGKQGLEKGCTYAPRLTAKRPLLGLLIGGELTAHFLVVVFFTLRLLGEREPFDHSSGRRNGTFPLPRCRKKKKTTMMPRRKAKKVPRERKERKDPRRAQNQVPRRDPRRAHQKRKVPKRAPRRVPRRVPRRALPAGRQRKRKVPRALLPSDRPKAANRGVRVPCHPQNPRQNPATEHLSSPLTGHRKSEHPFTQLPFCAWEQYACMACIDLASAAIVVALLLTACLLQHTCHTTEFVISSRTTRNDWKTSSAGPWRHLQAMR